jgi:hypothetical protein
MKNCFLILAVLILNLTVSIAQTYPKFVKPGSSYEVVTVDDTLWILTDDMVRKILKVDMENDVLNEQVITLSQEVEILKLQGEKKDTLISITEEDRDYYMNTWRQCSEDIEKLGKISNRKAAYTRIAIFTGAATTVIAFFLGGYLLTF